MSNDTDLRSVSERLGVATKQLTEGLRKAAENAGRSMAPLTRAINVDAGNIPEVESLATFLLQRDWPTTRVTPSQLIEYRRRAARILEGDWRAIQQAWPEAAYEIIQHRSA